jgi:hypothetical protein
MEKTTHPLPVNNGHPRAAHHVLWGALLLGMLFTMTAPAAGNNARSHAPWRFAPGYSREELFTDPQKADSFIREYLRWEGEFYSIIHQPRNGFTYDGYNLDPVTGNAEAPRLFSAPSKECLDVAITVKALAGDPYAALVVSPKNPSQAQDAALAVLERKISGYEEYLKKNPGYAGYLPWFVCTDEITPTPNWVNQFPGLDNGEWIWTLLAAERVLELQGHKELARRYGAYNNRLKENIVSIFYDRAAGKVRGDIKFEPSSHQGFSYSAVSDKCPCITGEHGIHEGMMLLLYVCLFVKNLPEGAVDRIWSDIAMKRMETKYGTTWEGWYASSHEEWAFLILPMRDMPEYKKLFRLREIIRSQNAREKGYPGFATSCLVDRDTYIDKAGIEGIASHPIVNNHTFALYGDCAMLLEFAGKKEGNYGLLWLLNMLKPDRMQGPLGAGESGNNNGTKVADVKTCDGSFTIDLALCGGLEKEMAELLTHEKRYDQFQKILGDLYRKSFGTEPLREPSGFASPEASVPQGRLGDYSVK